MDSLIIHMIKNNGNQASVTKDKAVSIANPPAMMVTQLSAQRVTKPAVHLQYCSMGSEVRTMGNDVLKRDLEG